MQPTQPEKINKEEGVHSTTPKISLNKEDTLEISSEEKKVAHATLPKISFNDKARKSTQHEVHTERPAHATLPKIIHHHTTGHQAEPSTATVEENSKIGGK